MGSPSSCSPFTNLGSDPEQKYFADGVTDDLTTDLSRIDESFVIAPATARTYKGKAVDAKEVGRELGVRYVMEGSVRRPEIRFALTRSSSMRQRAPSSGQTASRAIGPSQCRCRMRLPRAWPEASMSP